MSDGGGSDDERTIGDRFSDRCVAFGLGQHIRSSDRGTSTFKSHGVWIYRSQIAESEVAHGPRRGADVERIAGIDKDYAQAVEIR